MIMDQETSKRFLTGDRKTQYEYYMKATNLKRLFDSAAELKARLSETKSSLALHSKTLAACEDDERGKKAKLEDIKGVSEWQRKLNDSKKDIAWAVVLEKEASGPSLRRLVEDSKKNLADNRNNMGIAERARAKIEAGLLEKEAVVEEIGRAHV